MFSYRSILSRAWKITKQYKKLWIFGALALILSAGGEYQVLTKILNEDYGSGVYERIQNGGSLANISFWTDLFNLIGSDSRLGLGIILLIALLAFIAFIVLWISINSQISLVKWVKTLSVTKKKEQKISIWEGISKGGKEFWRVLGLNIIFKVGISLLFLLLSIPLIYLFFQNSDFAILTYTIFFTLFIPLSLSLALIIKYAAISVILEKATFVRSIEEASKVFHKNWLVSLEIAILLFLINFLVGLVIVFILSVIILPVILTLIIFNFLAPLYIFAAFGFAALILTAAILMTFQSAAWTILFEELREDKGKAKLERVFKRKK